MSNKLNNENIQSNILEMIEDGMVCKDDLLTMLLGGLSNDELQDLCERNEILWSWDRFYQENPSIDD